MQKQHTDCLSYVNGNTNLKIKPINNRMTAKDFFNYNESQDSRNNDTLTPIEEKINFIAEILNELPVTKIQKI